MLERQVTIINELGLHARAAAKLVRLANTFASDITLVRPDSGIEADAKDILSVLYIAAGRGVELTIKIDGEDEEDAANAVEPLFLNGFGEL